MVFPRRAAATRFGAKMFRHFCLPVAIALLASQVAIAGNCRTVYQQAVVHQNVVVDQYQAFVPVIARAFKVEVLPQYYAQVGEEYRQAEFARQVARELLSLQQQQQAALQPAQMPKAADTASTPQAIPKLTVKSILEARCVQCHKAGSEGTHINLTGDPETFFQEERNEVLVSLVKGRMPKNADRIPQAELNIIADWAGTGPKRSKK